MPKSGSFVILAWVLSGLTTASAEIHFGDFASTPGLNLRGDAKVAGKALRLTPAKENRSGAAWSVEKQPVGSGFDTTFRFQLTKQNGLGDGADGFAFVLQNSGPAALGGRGSAGGFAAADPSFHPAETGIPWNIAVHFDTFRNEQEGDPSSNFIAVRTHGKANEMQWPAPRIAFTPRLPIELKDGKVHTARIFFSPPQLAVYLDGAAAPVLEAKVDLSFLVDRKGGAWVGFTASTGGGYGNHDILSWSFQGTEVSSNMSIVSSDISFLMSTCLPDRELCTPERAVIEPTATGYHIVLPGNLEWGASIAVPAGRAAVIDNAHGIVCWNPKVRAAEGCSGPSGAALAAGPGYLSPSDGEGALITRTREGRLWFSVNGRPADLKANEGFYEFDIEFRR